VDGRGTAELRVRLLLGPEQPMEEHFEKHPRALLSRTCDGKDHLCGPVLRKTNPQSVRAVGFFLKQEKETRKFLCEHLGIEELDSVLFVMNEPPC